MKKKIIIGATGMGLLLAAILGAPLAKKITEEPELEREHDSSSIRVVNVDEVVKAPERYQGFLGVEGIVIKVNESKRVFLLGCKDACIIMPVKYTGQLPEAKSKIIVYGQINKQKDGKYIFQAKKVKTK